MSSTTLVGNENIANLLAVGIRRNVPAMSAQLATLEIVPSVLVLCLVLAAAIGMVSAFVPAYNAARISIVDALKSDD